MNRRKLLIADDSEMNRAMLANMLDHDFQIIEAVDGHETISALEMYEGEIAALLLDIVMPEMDGFQVLEEMQRRGWTESVPTIMISAETGSAYIDRAFELGASDYINRPFTTGIIRRRIINAILLHTKKQQLIDIVSNYSYRHEKNTEEMVSILSSAVEHRCCGGGRHMAGVGCLTGLLLRCLLAREDVHPLDPADVEAVCMAASLHDIGKLMIPRELLEKPDRLTPEEYEIVKRHTVIGAQLIAELPVYQGEKLTKYAMEICRWHHERWNGEGYPDGLKGDKIPLAAQIVSLADAYDVLVHQRSYKAPCTHEQAMAMLHNGDCGSFNPLLLSCLDEVGEAARRGVDRKAAGRRSPRRTVEKLYRGQDLAAARMTRQLEDAYAKQDFLSALSGEIWFEYTPHPSSLRLSRGATEQTGLPSMIVEPLDDPDFLARVGAETVDAVRRRLADLSMEEAYLEMAAQLVLNGQPRRCQLAILVLRSAAEHGRCSALFGRVIDMDDNCERLERYDRAVGHLADRQLLLPVTMGRDDVLRVTAEQLGPVLQSYRAMFQTVRLVDPGICMQVTSDAHGHSVDKTDHCYAIWGKNRRCEHCISQDAVRTRTTQSKVETIGSDVFYVIAICVEVDGIPYSLECINPIHSDDMVGSGEENILNQLLVRNRQVYTDSATQVFNRRYYDERLRSLTGEYALAMIDLDNFKEINDRFGHPAGDAALFHAAQTMRSMLRSGDELVRYGGDEFFLLFHGLPAHVLARKLEDICRAVAALTIPEYPDLHLSLSIGGAYGSARVSELVGKADLALYRAKRTKNCAVVYEE